MPSTSDKQHRAMEAAKHGHSTLGIPQKVGADFVAADAGKKMDKGGDAGRRVTEHDDHFLVEGDHGAFKVAKAGLHPDTIEHFRKKYATGGDVGEDNGGDALDDNGGAEEPVEEGPEQSVGSGMGDVKKVDSHLEGNPRAQKAVEAAALDSQNNPPPPPGMQPQAWQDALAAQRANGLPTDAASMAKAGWASGATAPDTRSTEPLTNAGLVGKTPRSPLPTSGVEMTPQDQATAGIPGPDLQKHVTANLPEISDAEKADVAAAGAAREADTAKRAAAANDYQAEQDARVKSENDLQASADAETNQVKAEGDQLRKDILDSKIDPDHYWHSQGMAGRIKGSIGILLSGFGQGLSAAGGHQTGNMAMQVIQKHIDEDIDAQKANLHTKESLLADNYRRLGDIRLATAMTRQHLTTVAAAQAQKMASINGQADVQLRNQLGQAAAQLSLDQGAREIGTHKALLKAQTANLDIDTHNTLEMAKVKAAADAQAAGKVPREMQGAKISNYNSIINDLDEHQQLLDKAVQGPVAGRIASWMPGWTEQGALSGTINASADLLREKLASALGGGVASDARIHQAIKSVPDQFKSPKEAKMILDQIKSYLESGRDEYIREQGGVGFRVAPGSNAPIQKTPAKPKGD